MSTHRPSPYPAPAPRRPASSLPAQAFLLALAAVVLLAAGACGERSDGSTEAPAAGARADASASDSRGAGEPASQTSADEAAPGGEPAGGAAAPPPASGLPVVAFLGDSLTAGYGLPAAQAFPARLEERLRQRGLPFRAVNAGVSGDTSAGGLSRLDWVLSSNPDVLVVELGPNDGLRGLDLAMTRENLRSIVRRALDRDVRVLLVGMRIPPNYGPQYAGEFQDLFPRLAEELEVPLVPFLLEGVGGEAELNQADGIHPTAEGQRIIAGNVEPHLVPLVRAEWEERGGPPEGGGRR